MTYYVYRHLEENAGKYPDNWELVGTFDDINLADAKAVELCGQEPYDTEPRGSELRRGFFGRKGKASWDAMIVTKAIKS